MFVETVRASAGRLSEPVGAGLLLPLARDESLEYVEAANRRFGGLKISSSSDAKPQLRRHRPEYILREVGSEEGRGGGLSGSRPKMDIRRDLVDCDNRRDFRSASVVFVVSIRLDASWSDMCRREWRIDFGLGESDRCALLDRFVLEVTVLLATAFGTFFFLAASGPKYANGAGKVSSRRADCGEFVNLERASSSSEVSGNDEEWTID